MAAQQELDLDSVIDPDPRSVSFPCLRARQPIGDLFLGIINYKDLELISRFDVRRIVKEERDVETYLGIQRPLEHRRRLIPLTQVPLYVVSEAGRA
jgi:hypothetical protein